MYQARRSVGRRLPRDAAEAHPGIAGGGTRALLPSESRAPGPENLAGRGRPDPGSIGTSADVATDPATTPRGLERVREFRSRPCSVHVIDCGHSTDPELVAKVTDIIGLYLAPPHNTVVLCVDQKSQVQALNRTRKDAAPCSAGTPSSSLTTKYGTAPPPCSLRSRSPPNRSPGCARTGTGTRSSSAFLKHLARACPVQELHLVMDNYAATSTLT